MTGPHGNDDQHQREPGFDDLVGSLRAELDRKVDANRPVPDFAAMLERAHELDPDVVDEDTLAQVRELPPITPLRARTSESFDDLAPFTAALRAQLDAGLAEHRARQIPPPRFARPRPLVRARGWSWAAAVVLLLVGGVVSATIGGGDPLMEADSSDSANPSVRETVGPRPPVTRVDAPIESVQLTPPSPEIARAPTPRAPTLEGPSAPQKRKRTRPEPESSTDPLAELDARAQALWRAGDLDGAELLFREIVERGGRGRWAELAYAELFSLAQGQPGTQRDKLWREYLARFPAGRYSEDARVGLCRRANTTERATCWTDYLAQHPDGTYADEANRALGSTESNL